MKFESEGGRIEKASQKGPSLIFEKIKVRDEEYLQICNLSIMIELIFLLVWTTLKG